MGKVKISISMSLDGYVAGPDQSEETRDRRGASRVGGSAPGLPRGPRKGRRRGEREHADAGGSSATWARSSWAKHVRVAGLDRGATTLKGWWETTAPTPSVFVLTHHAREPLELQGGTTFHFVTTESSRPSSRRGQPPATRTSLSAAVRAQRSVSGVGSAGRAPRLDRPRDPRRRRPAVRPWATPSPSSSRSRRSRRLRHAHQIRARVDVRRPLETARQHLRCRSLELPAAERGRRPRSVGI